MSKPYLVDLDRLDTLIARMATFDSAVEGAGADVDRAITDLHVTWTGDAATAQKTAHDTWLAQIAQMRTTLADLRAVAVTAHQHYDKANTANNGIWRR